MTNVGVLGTGVVGQTLARRLAEVGHVVAVGARSATSPSLNAFAADDVTTGSFSDAVRHGDIVINATNGQASLAALESVGAELLAGKTLIDVANDLEPVDGGFPAPKASPTNSLGLRIQQAYPHTQVVKTLNTMNCTVMADPASVPGDHVAFLSGDDAAAKAGVRDLLVTMGWRDRQLFDLGGIDTAAGPEMTMLLWMQVTIARGAGAPRFNWAINAADR